jgi:hypothetical protein
MLVRFSPSRAWRSSAVLASIGLAACSVVVGELPEPLPGSGGPMAGVGAGGDAGPGGETSGGSMQQGGSASSSSGASSAGTATGGTGSSDCDVDRDHHASTGKCGGDDCDDQDPEVSPDQTRYSAERQPNVDFDYDCNGAEEQEQQVAVMCSGVAVGACPSEVGFLKTLPACGVAGSWGKCQKTPPLNTCDPVVIDGARRMRCR